MKNLKRLVLLILLAVGLASCSVGKDAKIELVDMKTAKGIDEMYNPIDVTSVFPAGTTRVFCWFTWKNAEKGIYIMSRWKYVTDDIPIMHYSFGVSRKQGQGGISLVMPEGKTLPAGLYKVTLESEKKELKSMTFKVLGSS